MGRRKKPQDPQRISSTFRHTVTAAASRAGNTPPKSAGKPPASNTASDSWCRRQPCQVQFQRRACTRTKPDTTPTSALAQGRGDDETVVSSRHCRTSEVSEAQAESNQNRHTSGSQLRTVKNCSQHQNTGCDGHDFNTSTRRDGSGACTEIDSHDITRALTGRSLISVVSHTLG